MAISISMVFDNLYLTAHLPEKVTITTRKGAMLPRNGQLALNFYTEAFVQGSNTVKVYYRTTRDNERHAYTYSLGRMLSTTEGIVTRVLSHQQRIFRTFAK